MRGQKRIEQNCLLVERSKKKRKKKRAIESEKIHPHSIIIKLFVILKPILSELNIKQAASGTVRMKKKTIVATTVCKEAKKKKKIQ